MRLIPMTMRAANEFVLTYHRHHGKVRGCKFCIGVLDDEQKLRGVAVVGRPVSRYLDTGLTAEVTRLCTDGTKNACSFLYAACARIARQMGYDRIITYILESENGASLRASGWSCAGLCGGGNWRCSMDCKQSICRPRADSPNLCVKRLYYMELR